MADSATGDSPAVTTRRTPSAAHAHQKRNNARNRKSNPQLDGAVSDGALVNTNSPRSRKPHHKQRFSVAVDASPEQQNSMGSTSAQTPRPVSMHANQPRTTPAKEQAYAGPTFQASPAASSLPVPKFFSRSLPNVAEQPSLQGSLLGESSPRQTALSPEADVVAPVPLRQYSPLDIFFNADRAEKERLRSSSGSLSPQSARRPPPPATAPRNVVPRSGRGVFLNELDGDDQNMSGPGSGALNTRPMYTQRTSSSPGMVVRPDESDDERQVKTKSLKELLFAAATTPPPSHNGNRSGTQTPDGFFGSPSPFQQRPVSGPTTPQPSSEQQHHYSLHYGNRNLSPLFKAAKSETPPQPSSLRREMAHQDHSNPVSTELRPPGDINSFARIHNQEHVWSSTPAETPPFPYNGDPRPLEGRGNLSGSFSTDTPPNNVQHGNPGTAPSMTPRSGAPRDVRGMEDDLRRMLRIA